MIDSHILAWEDEPPEHPVIAELRAQPGRWAILRDQESHPACLDHPNVETKADVDCHGADVAKARWVPDPVADGFAVGLAYARAIRDGSSPSVLFGALGEPTLRGTTNDP